MKAIIIRKVKHLLFSRNIQSLYSTVNEVRNQYSVGFIGLGNMGSNMCRNLIQSKLASKVFIYDKVDENMKKLETEGVFKAQNVDQIAEYCNVIITMVPATNHVTSLLLGTENNGLFSKSRKGTIFIDSSTIDPLVSKTLHLKAKEYGLKMIDAPVSGGVTGANAGTLTFMCGGEAEDIEQIKDLLGTMGKNIIHCGVDGGSGGIAKLCNNLSLAISMIGTSEAMSLGIKLGMDPSKLAQVMNTSTAKCWSSELYNPVPGIVPNVPSSREYNGGFGSALMEKDLTLAMNVASAVKSRTPLGSVAHQLYGLLCQHGYENKDFSIIFEYLNKKS